MKKSIVLLACMAAVLFSCKKQGTDKPEPTPEPSKVTRVLEDFENGGKIEAWNAESGAKFEIVDNPSKKGINTSAKVGKYTTAEAEWDFVWTTCFDKTDYENPAFLNFSKDGYIITVDCLAPAAGIPVYLKLEGNDVASCEITTVKTKKANEWETLVFDYEPNSLPDGAYRNFVICADAGGTTGGTVIYFDNFNETKGE